ncbi:MAG: hypothetical protein JKY51_01650 [Opitutaceae bacterium]|nr:hypothetical protein [Opitutaceae bacterium]
MKVLQLILWSMIASATCAFSNEIKIGDSKDTVLDLLGDPSGFMEINETLVLFFDRGEIILKNDIVSDFDLVSEEEVQLNKKDEIKRLAILEKEGLALKEEKLSDPDFIYAPTIYQIAYWKDFRARYPMIPVNNLIDTLEIKNSEELADLRNQTETDQYIKDLEYRLLIAEEQAANVRRNTFFYTSYLSYPSYFSPYHRRWSGNSRHRHHESNQYHHTDHPNQHQHTDHPEPEVTPTPPRHSPPSDALPIPKPPKKVYTSTKSTSTGPIGITPRTTQPVRVHLPPSAPKTQTSTNKPTYTPPAPTPRPPPVSRPPPPLTTGNRVLSEKEQSRESVLE